MNATLFCIALLAPAQTPVREFAGSGAEVRSVAFSPDGKSLAAGGRSTVVRVWEVASGKQIHLLTADGGDAYVAGFGDGKGLVTAGGAGSAPIVWDLATGRRRHTLKGRADTGATRLASSPDGKRIVSSSGTGGVRLWDATTGKVLHALHRDEAGSTVAFSRDGRLVAWGGDGVVKMWTVKTGELRREFGGMGKVQALAFSADGERLYAADARQLMFEWSLKDGGVRRDWNTGHGAALALAVSPDGGSLAAATADGVTLVWELATLGQRRYIQTDRGGTTFAVAFAPDGRSVATGGVDRVVRQWDLTAGWEASSRATPFPEAQFDDHWAALAREDSHRAYNSVWALAVRSKESVPLLAKRYTPPPAADDAKVARLVAALDDEASDRREAATKELAELGPAVRPLLERALRAATALEPRSRLAKLVKALEQEKLTGEPLRRVRAAEALRLAGTPEARRLLETLR